MKKAARKAALANFKAAKERRQTGLDSNSELLDDADQNVGNDDVYDVVDEKDYADLVESRRQREDFVVDDDGLGYYDDGEERYGDEAGAHEDANRNKKRAAGSANATLTSAALKKARKTAAAAKYGASAENNDASTSGMKNSSMWDFVNKGTGATGSDNNDNNRSSAKAAGLLGTTKRGAAVPSKDLDSLLGELDDAPASGRSHHRGNRQSLSRRSRVSGRSARGSRRPASSRFRSSSSSSSSYRGGNVSSMESPPRSRCREEIQSPDLHDDDDDGGGFNTVDDDVDNDDNTMEATPENNSSENKKDPSPSLEKSSKVSFETDMNESDDPNDKDHDQASAVVKETSECANPQPRRRLLARPKLGKLSAPAQKALEAKKRTLEQNANVKPTIAQEHQAPLADTTSASFKPATIASETTLSSLSTTAGQMQLRDFLKTSENKGEDSTSNGQNYLDMFWIDIAEKNGDIILYGKVAVPAAANAPQKFVSACAVVTGQVRNLFVLPRKKAGEEGYESMMDVHQEINTLLHGKGIIPRTAGASWAGKPVKRNYAFGDSSVPREEVDYLKVVYDAKYPVPSEEACNNGGEKFAKILGAGASTIENFIVKRKLMGPCWIRILQPTPTGAPTSWCKLEFKVDSPKRVSRLDVVAEGQGNLVQPPPPVVTMSLKLKTVVNPKTHKQEIISISAVCHKNVLLETSSDESSKHMTQLSLIRPLASSSGGVAQFPRDMDQAIAAGMPQLRRETNERAMLSRLFAQIGQWDPDVIVGHNAWGFDMEVLLTRCMELKVPVWSKIGRRRRMQLPSKTYFSSRKDMAIADAISGRLLCDTYLSAKELLRETTYSLTNLAATILKTTRQEIEPVDIPKWFDSSKTIVQLALTTLFDAQLVQRLMFNLQVLPLTKQLTCIAGNLWSHTLKSNRAERTEYLLLHEFHRLKFLPPEKRRPGKRGDSGKREKAKFSGGLVLEPKRGLYDSYILLLDFNSLYPSIIQEYNLCFTTVAWSGFQEAAEGEAEPRVPPLPDAEVERGVLPRVIKSLVDRRRAVKKFLKTEKNPEKKKELDIRQQALKLTANSMYGCLGFSNSRFFAQPIAAMVTAMGRETLQRTVDIAQNTVGLDVIYGDTDSIMINTRISDENQLATVRTLGEKVKKEVNKLYRTLELEIDGIFRSMLLLKKKKYAAKTVEELPNGEVKYGQELKGLDLVRRDWCIQSKDTGRFVTEQILSGQDTEVVVQKIFSHMEELAKKMRSNELPLEKYIITKGLSKHPADYPDGKSQPHVQVAKMMLKNNRPVNTGDHIPYIIVEALPEEGKEDKGKALPAVERARHPDDIIRSGGVLKPDVEWYLSQQILPPIGRLCEPIEETSLQALAKKLGLEASRYSKGVTSSSTEIDDENLVDYTPASCLPDEERFKGVEKLRLFCLSCGVDSEFPGVFQTQTGIEDGSQPLVSGLCCTNPECKRPEFWGQANQFECYARISNSISIWVRGLMTKYYEGLVRCDEPGCGLETRQLSVAGAVCLQRGCNGRMLCVDSEKDVHNHLKYLETLFNVDRACEQLEKKKTHGRKIDILKGISKHDRSTFDELHAIAKQSLDASAFNWVTPTFWKGLFAVGSKQ